jgi:hypothetical protein
MTIHVTVMKNMPLSPLEYPVMTAPRCISEGTVVNRGRVVQEYIYVLRRASRAQIAMRY